MFPMLSDDVELKEIVTQDDNPNEYYAEFLDGHVYPLSESTYYALQNADGTHELDLSDSRRPHRLLRNLKMNHVITTRRFVCRGLISRIVLMPIGRRAQQVHNVAVIINTVLPVSSCFLFLVGVLVTLFPQQMYWEYFATGSTFVWIVLYYAILAISIIFHELGHMIAAIAYGQKVREFGILILCFIKPIGAYVAYVQDEDLEKKRKIQISLSGIEMNLLLVGFFLIMNSVLPFFTVLWYTGAIMNGLLVVLNLIPAFGLDGEHVLSAILDADDIGAIARAYVLKKEYRRYLLSKGTSGKLQFGGYLMLVSCQIGLVVLLAYETLQSIMNW